MENWGCCGPQKPGFAGPLVTVYNTEAFLNVAMCRHWVEGGEWRREGDALTQQSLSVIYRLGQAQIDSYARNVNGIETFDGEAHFQT